MNFLTIGHRGVMGVEPENTLRSFVAAQEAGLDVIELDLHQSKDGALVVMHDARVDRTTDGTGAIADKTLDELRALDAGRGERIPCSRRCWTPSGRRSRRRSRTCARRRRWPR